MKQSIRELVEVGAVRFYCEDWAPNGTSALIVTDNDGVIQAVLDEALFGPRAKKSLLHHSDTAVVSDGESVFAVQLVDDPAEGLTEECLKEGFSFNEVYEVTFDSVLRDLTQSPVRGRFEALRELVEAVQKVS